MKILFTLCWLGEPWRVDRYKSWIDYNRNIKSSLGWDKIILIDNASDLEVLKSLGGTILDEKYNVIYQGSDDLHIIRCEEHLPRTGNKQYPYCWRGLHMLKDIINKYQATKVLGIDSDFYVLSPRLADYIKNLASGWVSFFCHKYNFPEAGLWVLCSDAFNTLFNFNIPSYTHYNNRAMEKLLPFTYVNKTEFIGDRYGEDARQQTPDMDYYGQLFPGVTLTFNMGK